MGYMILAIFIVALVNTAQAARKSRWLWVSVSMYWAMVAGYWFLKSIAG